MDSVRMDRDASLAVPAGLDESEQQEVMLKADRLGLRKRTDDLTALPAGSPPPGSGWRKVSNIPAPGSGKPYTIYILPHDPAGRGPTGTKSNPPSKHKGVTSKTHHQKPHAPAGSSDATPEQSLANKKQEKWLGAIGSDHLSESIEDLRKTLEDSGATEGQIAGKVQKGLQEARNVSLLGRDDDPRVGVMMQQVAQAVKRVGDMRNDAFEKLLQQEDRTPGSVSDLQMQEQIKGVLGAERQRQLLGADDPNVKNKAMDLVVKAIGIVGDRKADAVKDMLEQDKRAPGSVSQDQFRKGIVDLLGMARESQLLGIDRPKTNAALSSVAEVMKLLVHRKAEARRKMLQQQKDDPNSGITDQQIQEATIELNKMREQARSLGVMETE